MLTHGEQLLAEWRHPDPIIGETCTPVITGGRGGVRSRVLSTVVAWQQQQHQEQQQQRRRQQIRPGSLALVMLVWGQQHRQTSYTAACLSMSDRASNGPRVLIIGTVSARCSPTLHCCVPLFAVPLPPPPLLLCRALLCWWHSIQPEPPDAQGREWG